MRVLTIIQILRDVVNLSTDDQPTVLLGVVLQINNWVLDGGLKKGLLKY
jgi:hypothetical protein